MLTAWMWWALLLSAVAAAAAWAAAGIAAALGWPRRWPWAAGLAASVVVPLGHLVGGRPAASGGGSGELAALPGTVGGALEQVGLLVASTPLWVERVLAGGWILVSLVMLGALLRSAWGLYRLRRRSRSSEVGGTPVLVSPEGAGPSVAGLIHPVILLPAWLSDWESEERRLVVSHEREHIAARDHWLALAGLLSLVLLPWNPVVWWQVRRLRLAVEMDCDRRVLRRKDVGPRAYGQVLFRVATRESLSVPGVPFAQGPPLERRIRAITAKDSPGLFRALLVAGGVAAFSPLVLQAAGEPGSIEIRYLGRLVVEDAPVSAPASPGAPSGPDTLPPPPGEPPHAAVRQALQRHHPDLLGRGLDSDSAVWFVVEEKEGPVLQTGIASGSIQAIHAEVQRRYPSVVSDYVLALQWTSDDGATELRVLWMLSNSE